MRFLVDNQLPAALARRLASLGHDAVHVLDIGLGEAADSVIWARAAADGRVVVSKDEDFLGLAMRPGDSGRLLWIRTGNCRTAPLLGLLDEHLEALLAAFSSGQRVVEIR